jgi:hypothetical protein
MVKALQRDKQPIAQLPLLPNKLKKDVKQPIVLQAFTNNQKSYSELGIEPER